MSIVSEPCPADEVLFELAEGVLDTAGLALVDRHLDGCAQCRAVVAAAGAERSSEAASDHRRTRRDDSADTPAAQPHEARLDVAVGDRIGRYIVAEELGRGGMGVVLAADDPQLQRRVAIKLIRPSSQVGPTARSRLLLEARALARLSHANVVTIFDVGEFRSGIFIAMELIDGQSLQRWCRGRAWPQIIDCFIGAGRGLAAAHAEGLVHRDFKPANVLVGADGRARVTDFGLATASANAASDDSSTTRVPNHGPPSGPVLHSRLTQTGTVLGTPAYMAPEQFDGRRATQASDQFAFCVALYEAIFGSRPFPGQTLVELAVSLRGPLVFPRSPAGLPAALATILRVGLAPDPRARHPSMEALLGQLHALGHRRQRQWTLGLAAIGAAATGLTGLWLAAPAPRDGCQDTQLRPATVWNETARDALRERFAARPESYAQSTVQNLERGLDEYAQQWAEQSATLCALDRSDKATAAAFDRGTLCLDARLVELDAAVSVLASPATPIVHAASVLHGLTPSTTCAAPETLGQDAAPVPAPSIANEVRRLEATLAVAETLRRAVQPTQGLRRLDVDAEALREIDYPPLRARAMHLRGSLMVGTAPMAEAVAALQAAYEYAIAHGLDRTAARCAVRLMQAFGGEYGDFAEAARWAPLARMLAEGSPSPHDLANYLQLHAFIAHTEGRFDEATAELLQARALYLRDGPATPYSVAGIAVELGNIALKRLRYDQARVNYEAALDGYTESLGSTHPLIEGPLRGLAQVAIAERDFEEARALMQQADAIVVETFGPAHRRHGTNLGVWGSLAEAEGDNRRALDFHLEALEIYRRTIDADDLRLGAALGKVALIHVQLGDYEKALPLQEDALDNQEAALGSESTAAGIVHHNLGEIHAFLGNLDRATTHYERAIEIFEGNEGALTPKLAFPLTGLGEVLLRSPDPEPARSLLERALSLTAPHANNEKEWAETAFALARALAGHASASAADALRARTLAEQAAAQFSLFPGYEAERDDVVRWIESL